MVQSNQRFDRGVNIVSTLRLLTKASAASRSLRSRFGRDGRA
jgi:hypothetical protein